MNDIQIEIDKDSYQSLKQKEEPKEDNSNEENTRIEKILKYINQDSSKFQVKVLSITMVLYFSVGIHVFTLVYFFLTPDFYSASDPTKSKALYF